MYGGDAAFLSNYFDHLLLLAHQHKVAGVKIEAYRKCKWLIRRYTPYDSAAFTIQLECGPIPNVMAALPNIGGAFRESSVIPFLVPRRKLWLTPTARVPCRNAANIGDQKTWTQSEFCSWQNSLRGQEPPKMYT